jgi:hypothetical protein
VWHTTPSELLRIAVFSAAVQATHCQRAAGLIFKIAAGTPGMTVPVVIAILRRIEEGRWYKVHSAGLPEQSGVIYSGAVYGPGSLSFTAAPPDSILMQLISSAGGGGAGHAT